MPTYLINNEQSYDKPRVYQHTINGFRNLSPYLIEKCEKLSSKVGCSDFSLILKI
uniref:Uncharacterized protein n=1 Tax=Arundo donax TaxID=35708 RepID=A0A0A9H7C0_ARUDO